MRKNSEADLEVEYRRRLRDLQHGNQPRSYQALLKAKYCPRVAAASCTQKNKKEHVTFTFDLEIQQGSRGCRGTCACKISSS